MPRKNVMLESPVPFGVRSARDPNLSDDEIVNIRIPISTLVIMVAEAAACFSDDEWQKLTQPRTPFLSGLATDAIRDCAQRMLIYASTFTRGL